MEQKFANDRIHVIQNQNSAERSARRGTEIEMAAAMKVERTERSDKETQSAFFKKKKKRKKETRRRKKLGTMTPMSANFPPTTQRNFSILTSRAFRFVRPLVTSPTYDLIIGVAEGRSDVNSP